jgi:MerR family transcriptional regulator, copper efflux regulator
MTRGQLARKAGVHGETIRFYERKGLIPEPRRLASGYRQFSDETVGRIRFIKRAQDLGFSLGEILELLSLRLDPESDRADVKHRVDEKVSSIEGKMADLQRMKDALAGLMSCCSGKGSTRECPILEFMEAGQEVRLERP